MHSDADDAEVEVVKEDGCVVVQSFRWREVQLETSLADTLQLLLLVWTVSKETALY